MPTRRLFVKTIMASVASAIALMIILPTSYKARIRKTGTNKKTYTYKQAIYLPIPKLKGNTSVEEALANRRSIRKYLNQPLSLEMLSQVLWAAYGITETRYGFKTTPSAGATYPLEIYSIISPNGVVIENEYLEPGSYRYDPHTHSLRLIKKGDLSWKLYKAALEQDWVLEAPVNLVFTAIYERTTNRYGDRGIRYVWIEVGHAGQNVYLQTTAMGLATVAIGAFYDEEVRTIIGASENEHPLYIMPIAIPVTRYTLVKKDLEAYIYSNR